MRGGKSVVVEPHRYDGLFVFLRFFWNLSTPAGLGKIGSSQLTYTIPAGKIVLEIIPDGVNILAFVS